MKRIAVWMLVWAGATQRVFAHPGHGEGGGWDPLHFLLEPRHAAGMGATLVAVGALWALRRRITSSPKAAARARAIADRRDRPDATASG